MENNQTSLPADGTSAMVEDVLARALVTTLLGDMTKDQGRFILEQFITAMERKMGGTLVVMAPGPGSKERKILEFSYSTDARRAA